MFSRERTQSNTRSDRDRTRTPLDAVERGYVTSATELDAEQEPVIEVKPRDSESPIKVYVPHFGDEGRGLPKEGTVVYFIRTTRNKGIMLGSWSVEHDGYRFERRLDQPATDGLLKWGDEGNLRLESETVRRVQEGDVKFCEEFEEEDMWQRMEHPPKDVWLDTDEGNVEFVSEWYTDEGHLERRTELHFDDGNISLESFREGTDENIKRQRCPSAQTQHLDSDDQESTLGLSEGTVKLEQFYEDDGEEYESWLHLLGDSTQMEIVDGPSITVDKDDDTVTIETDSGFTITVDGEDDTLRVNGGTEPAVVDVEVEKTTVDGTEVVGDITVHESDDILVPEQ